MRTLPTSAVATALTTALFLLSGCSADDTDSGRPDQPSASSSATGSAVDTLLDTGLQQLSAGAIADASGTFKSVLVIDPENVYATYNLGYIAENQGDIGEAVAKYTAAIDEDPTFAPALYNLAILTEPTDLEAAVDLYRRVVDSEPDDAAAHMRLGFALRHLGKKGEARAELREGIKLDPNMAQVKSPHYTR